MFCILFSRKLFFFLSIKSQTVFSKNVHIGFFEWFSVCIRPMNIHMCRRMYNKHFSLHGYLLYVCSTIQKNHLLNFKSYSATRLQPCILCFNMEHLWLQDTLSVFFSASLSLRSSSVNLSPPSLHQDQGSRLWVEGAGWVGRAGWGRQLAVKVLLKIKCWEPVRCPKLTHTHRSTHTADDW